MQLDNVGHGRHVPNHIVYVNLLLFLILTQLA